MKKLYPTVKFADSKDLTKQVKHVLSEAAEVEFEMYNPNKLKLLMELCDLEHSIQTAFEIAEKNGVDIDSIRVKVVEKNQKRGYYEG